MNNLISKEKAKQMIDLYRTHREAILDSKYQGQDLLVYSETFSRDAFDKLLVDPACVSVRVYSGMSEDLKVHSIIVAVDAAGNDVFTEPTDPAATDGEDEVIIEEGNRCPPFCDGPTNP